MIRRTQLAAAALLGTVLATPAAAQRGDAGTLVVVNKSANTATLIDLATRAIVATVPTGVGPHEVAITRDGRTAVVTDYGGRGAGGNTLTVIDVERAAVARTIDLGDHARPHGIAFLPGDTLVVVTSESSRTVLVAQVTAGAVARVVSTEQRGSHMLAVVGTGFTLYTGNMGDNSVSELDLRTGRHRRTFPAPAQPEAITVTADGREVWVGSNAEGTVSVIDPVNGGTRLAAEGFGWPYRILITPDNRTAIIPDLRRHDVRFLDRASHEELKRLEFPGAGPQGVTISGDGRTLFLSLSREDRVAVIDLASLEVSGFLAAGPAPDGVAHSPLVVRR